MSHLEIALEVGRSEGWVTQVRSGMIRDPGGSAVRRLIELCVEKRRL